MSTKTEFHDWWFAYPRRVGKRKAFEKWQIAVKEIAAEKGISESAAIKWLLDRTKLFATSRKAKGDFCPYPQTWLHQGRYDDDVSEWGVVSDWSTRPWTAQ